MKKKPAAIVNLDLFLVQVALAAVGCCYYGMRVLVLCLIAALTCFALDYICISLRRIPYRAVHLDSVCTGMTLALLMPATVSYDVLIIACFAAIIIGKQLFGGRANLLFSPAAVGYSFVMLSWESELLQVPQPFTSIPVAAHVDVATHASLSAAYNVSGVITTSDANLWLGNFAGAIGTTQILLLLVGALVLMLRRSISAPVCLSGIAMFVFYAAVLPSIGSTGITIRNALSTNMVLFGLIFFASDLRLAPGGLYGVLYGALVASASMLYTANYGLEYTIVMVVLVMSPAAVVMKQRGAEVTKRLEASRAAHPMPSGKDVFSLLRHHTE